MEPDRLARAVAGYLDGSAGAVEGAALAKATAADEALRAAIADQRRIDRWLRERVRTPAMTDQVMARLAGTSALAKQVMARLPSPAARPQRAPRPRHWAWVAAAALALALAGGWWLGPGDGTIAESRTDAGTVTIVRHDAAGAGGGLRDGDRLICSDDGAATVSYVDGSRLELSAATAGFIGLAADTGRRVALDRGRLAATIARQPARRPFVITTPHARFTVIGTRFTLAVTAADTRLEVSEGKVRCERLDDHRSLEVVAGESTIAPIPPPSPVAPVLRRYTAVADSYVSSTAPGASFGGERMLKVAAGGGHGELVGCLRFAPAPGPAEAVTLVLRRREGHGRIQVFRSADTAWQEATVRWYHLPARDPQPLASVDAAPEFLRIPLPATVIGDGELCLLLVGQPGASLAFASREDFGAEPVLEVSYPGTPAGTP